MMDLKSTAFVLLNLLTRFYLKRLNMKAINQVNWIVGMSLEVSYHKLLNSMTLGL